MKDNAFAMEVSESMESPNDAIVEYVLGANGLTPGLAIKNHRIDVVGTLATRDHLITCIGGRGHAIACTTRHGGLFFDPNAGEYSLNNYQSTGAGLAKILKEWASINADTEIAYHDFIIYPVRRAG